MSQQGLENTFVIIILGNEANQASIDRSSGCRKYHNYSLYSNSVVISRLASFRGIPSDNIVVFGYGSPCGYDMDIVPTSDIFFQLTIDEIYKETKTHERISFPQNVKYFIEIEDISTFLHTKIRSKHPNFFVFIDDHDVDEQLDFFELYRLFLGFKPQSLCIFADCCSSSTLVDICNVIHHLNLRFPREKLYDLRSDLLYEISKYHIYFSKAQLGGDIKSIFEHLLEFFKAHQTISESEKHSFNSAIFTLYHSVFKDYPPTLVIDPQILEMFQKDITTLDLSNLSENHQEIIQQYFPTIGDLFDIGYYLYKYRGLSYKYLFENLNSSFPILIELQNECRLNSLTLFRLLKKLFHRDIFKVPYLYLPIPPTFFVCTTSHHEAQIPTFGTWRITDHDKIIMGSPGMSAFIFEVFLFPHPDGISLDRLKELAQGTGTQTMQYAVSSGKGKKKWLSLNFRSFGACNSLLFSQLNMEDDKHPLSAQEILKLIDFSLVVKFKNDHETPYDENFPQDPALRPDYCAKNYGFQISAKIDNPNNCQNRYRLYENLSTQDHFSTEALADSRKKKTDAHYFDEASKDAKQHNHQRKKKVYKKILLSFDWNRTFPQNELDSFQFKSFDYYFFDLRNILLDIFERIKLDDYVLNRKERHLDIELEQMIYDWMKYFIKITPSYYRYIPYFASPFISYIKQSKFSLHEIQKWFFISFNIADQIVTPHFHNRKTFIENRLDNPFPLPNIDEFIPHF